MTCEECRRRGSMCLSCRSAREATKCKCGNVLGLARISAGAVLCGPCTEGDKSPEYLLRARIARLESRVYDLEATLDRVKEALQ